MFNFIKDTFNKTIIDLENPKILKTLFFSILITTIIAIIIFIFFYYFLFSSLFNLSDPSNFDEDGILYYNFSLKLFAVLLGIIQFFTSWILVSLILVPIGSIVIDVGINRTDEGKTLVEYSPPKPRPCAESDRLCR